MVHQDPGHIRTPDIFQPSFILYFPHVFFPPTVMELSNCEARIIFALNELRSSKKKSIRKVALIYNVPKSTLHDRINGIAFLANRRPGNQKLTEREKEIIVQYILDLDFRGFPAQIADVAVMADYFFAARDARPVGK